MNKLRNTYRINGKGFDEDSLKSKCLERINSPEIPGWEKEIWTFILNWLSDSDIIEVHTSGSTGKPKLISLQKKHMVESALATIKFFSLKRGDIVLLCLPVRYIAGKMMIVRALVGELDLHFNEPSSKPVIDEFDKITFTAMTPMQVVNLIQDDKGVEHLNRIDKLIIGGSSLPYGLDKRLQSLTLKIWQTYGMTETITHIALRKVNGTDRSDWYSALSGIKLIQDERNCLVINYVKIGVDHLITNDVVEFGAARQFKILGRVDNVINSGGVKLFPEQIEKKLQDLISNEFFIAGVQDENLGEKLVLFIEGKVPDEIEYKLLMTYINSRLEKLECPKQVIFKKSFERTLIGKIIRKKINN